MTQIGGAIGHPTTVIRDLRLGINGTDITLPEVHLFSAPVGDDSSYGLSGADVFANAREVTIDFQGMRLIVRGRARPVVARSGAQRHRDLARRSPEGPQGRLRHVHHVLGRRRRPAAHRALITGW